MDPQSRNTAEKKTNKYDNFLFFIVSIVSKRFSNIVYEKKGFLYHCQPAFRTCFFATHT